MRKMQQKATSFPLWKLKLMDKMLQLERVQKVLKARGVEESVVRAVLNIIKLNPEVTNSPDIQMIDIKQGNKTTTKQSSGKIYAPGSAEADGARMTE